MPEQSGIAPRGEPDTFQECLQRVNPSSASLENLAAQSDETPIIMLNLLRFRPRGDSSIYSMYAREAAPEVKKLDSFVAFFGATLQDLDPGLGFDSSWDAVVMPVYARRSAFLQLQQSRNYQLAIPYRSAGTSRRTLYVTRDGDALCAGSENASIEELYASRTPLDIKPGEVCSIELLSFKTDSSRSQYVESRKILDSILQKAGAETVLSLEMEVPVLSEDYWDHCILTRYPSRAALDEVCASKEWQQGKDLHEEHLERSLKVACCPAPLPV